MLLARHRGMALGTLYAFVLASAALVVAGPLNPPGGAVSSTYKTLTEVEPRIAINSTNTPGDANSIYKITQPGSYYLTGNITGVSGKSGIEIASSNVTLDLNGFDLTGVTGSLDGVTTVGSLVGVSVRNGSVHGWGNSGVDLGELTGDSSAVVDVRAGDNGSFGIVVGGTSTVVRCTAWANVGRGILAGASARIADCVAHQNVGIGIYIGWGSVISGCTVSQNTEDGIFTVGGAAITGCSAYVNTGNGINFGNGTTISGCAARANTLDGIRAGSNCRVVGNICTSNGVGDGAGIHATGADNRIEGNSCTSADRGIDIDFSGNIIIRNTCSGNTTNWDVAANNKCLVVNGVNAGAILGDSGGASLGSTDPNANFTY